VSERDAYEASQRQHVRDGSWEPPAAHPPEGSQPPDCPNCDGVEGMHTLRSCLSPPTPPPGPGQDVEEQARALPDVHTALHRLWTWAVGKEGYDKQAWVELENVVRAAQAEAERRAQEAEHGIARWEVYAAGLEAQVRSAREAAELTLNTLADIRRGFAKGVDPARWVEQASAPLRALSSSPVSSQREPKA
jgi:hypothetical protein